MKVVDMIPLLVLSLFPVKMICWNIMKSRRLNEILQGCKNFLTTQTVKPNQTGVKWEGSEDRLKSR